MKTKAQVIAISDHSVTVGPLLGNLKDKVFGLPVRDGLKKGQFVDILLHPSGQRAEGPRTG